MATNAKDLVMEIPPFVRFYKDDTVERPLSSPIVPPSLREPRTGVSSKDVLISENPAICARIYLPQSTKTNEQNQKLPLLVYFHGGGFGFESAFGQFYHSHINALVSNVNIIVVSVEYRLAPVHLLFDCWTSLEWVWNHSSKKSGEIAPWLVDHGDFDKIFIGGHSAGGNIVHHMVLRAGAVAETLPRSVKIYGAFLTHRYSIVRSQLGLNPWKVSSREIAQHYLT